ncbi:PREDICTED: F-box protein At4g05010-like [Camelina sativa]|uniref:F-box protein At4g05010-like n=1 Tax=Camelina sativa TaxID=90675 RepID=A0ABM0T898_CAMSA|nr:PREDICTED: F-box protein At4g05010-like [Camelina sativa]
MAFLSGGGGGFEVIKSKREYEGLGLGFVRFTRGLGRKRILISKSSAPAANNDSSPPEESNRSLLESLHQDILIRVLCHVDHEDLETLKRVSKTIRKAVIEAKKSHFDYSTPKKRLPFRDAVLIMEEDSNSNWDSSSQSDEMEPPNAPIRRRTINRESDLSKISMVLFK